MPMNVVQLNAVPRHITTLFFRWNDFQQRSSGRCANGIIFIVQALFEEWNRAAIINFCR